MPFCAECDAKRIALFDTAEQRRSEGELFFILFFNAACGGVEEFMRLIL